MSWTNAREAIANASQESSVYIGCDSQIYSKGKGKFVADYAIVVVLHKDSKHGCKIFHNYIVEPDYGVSQPRLVRETQLALEAYEAIADVVGGRHLEVHLDLNPDPRFLSNSVAAQAIGWVRSYGLEAKIKPNAPAASYAADHCARRKSIYGRS